MLGCSPVHGACLCSVCGNSYGVPGQLDLHSSIAAPKAMLAGLTSVLHVSLCEWGLYGLFYYTCLPCTVIGVLCAACSFSSRDPDYYNSFCMARSYQVAG